jgi:hypothetical protein
MRFSSTSENIAGHAAGEGQGCDQRRNDSVRHEPGIKTLAEGGESLLQLGPAE